jgi:hypothetical protein
MKEVAGFLQNLDAFAFVLLGLVIAISWARRSQLGGELRGLAGRHCTRFDGLEEPQGAMTNPGWSQ